MRRIILIFTFVLICAFSYNAEATESGEARDSYIKNAERVGQKAKLTYIIWDVYNAELFAEDGKFDRNKPFSIKLEYLRGAEGKKIADVSIDEIRGQGFRESSKLSNWKGLLADAIPDVNVGDTIEGVSAKGKLIFIYNGKKYSEIKNSELTKKFFDIWLSENTSENRLRKKLLGEI
jgi:hypothetical protein